MFGSAFRQDYLRRMTSSYYNTETAKSEYFFKHIPSKTINEEATVSEMWTHEDVPLFLLENGAISTKYTLWRSIFNFMKISLLFFKFYHVHSVLQGMYISDTLGLQISFKILPFYKSFLSCNQFFNKLKIRKNKILI